MNVTPTRLIADGRQWAGGKAREARGDLNGAIELHERPTRPNQITEITLLDRAFGSVREFSSLDHSDEPINDATAPTRVEQDQESDSAKGRVFEPPTTANKRVVR